MPSLRSMKMSYSPPPCPDEPSTPPPPPPHGPCSPCQHKNHSSPPPPKYPPKMAPAPVPSTPQLPFYPYFPPQSTPPPHSSRHPLEVGVSLGGLFFLSFLALALNHVFGNKMFVRGGGGELPSHSIHTAEAVQSLATQPQPESDPLTSNVDNSTGAPPPHAPGPTEPKKLGQEETHKDEQSEEEKKKKKVKADTVVQSLLQTRNLLKELLAESNNPHGLAVQQNMGGTSYAAVNNGDDHEDGDRLKEDNLQDVGAKKKPNEVGDQPKTNENDDHHSYKAATQPMGVSNSEPGLGRMKPTDKSGFDPEVGSGPEMSEGNPNPDELKHDEAGGNDNLEDLAEDQPADESETYNHDSNIDDDARNFLSQTGRQGQKKPRGGRASRGLSSSSERQPNILKTVGLVDRKLGFDQTRPDPEVGSGSEMSRDNLNEIKGEVKETEHDRNDGLEDQGDDKLGDELEKDEHSAFVDDDAFKFLSQTAREGQKKPRGGGAGRSSKRNIGNLNKIVASADRKLQPKQEENADNTNLEDKKNMEEEGDDVEARKEAIKPSSDEPKDEDEDGDDDSDGEEEEEDYSWLTELGNYDVMGMVGNLGSSDLLNKWSGSVEKLVVRNTRLVNKLRKIIKERENPKKATHSLPSPEDVEQKAPQVQKVEDEGVGVGVGAASEIQAASSMPKPDAVVESGEFEEMRMMNDEAEEEPAEAEQGRSAEVISQENYELRSEDAVKNIKGGHLQAKSGALKGNIGRQSKKQSKGKNTSSTLKGQVMKGDDYKDMSSFTELGGEGKEEEMGFEESGEGEEVETLNDEKREKGMWPAEETPPLPDHDSLVHGSDVVKNIDVAQLQATSGALKGNLGRRSGKQAKEKNMSGALKGQVKKTVHYKDLSPFSQMGGEGEEREDERGNEEIGKSDQVETMRDEETEQGMWETSSPLDYESLVQGSGVAKNIEATQLQAKSGAIKGNLGHESGKLVKGKNMSGTLKGPVDHGEDEEETGNEEIGEGEEVETMKDEESEEGMWETPPQLDYESLVQVKESGATKNMKPQKRADQLPQAKAAMSEVVGDDSVKNWMEKDPLSFLKVKGISDERSNTPVDKPKPKPKNIKSHEAETPAMMSSAFNVANAMESSIVPLDMGVGDDDKISQFTNPDEKEHDYVSSLVKGISKAEEKSPMSSLLKAKNTKRAQPQQAKAMSAALAESENVGADLRSIFPEEGNGDGRIRATAVGKHGQRQRGARVKRAEHQRNVAGHGSRTITSERRAAATEVQEPLGPDPAPEDEHDVEATQIDAAHEDDHDFEAPEVDEEQTAITTTGELHQSCV